MKPVRLMVLMALGLLVCGSSAAQPGVFVQPVQAEVESVFTMPASGTVRLNLADRKAGWRLIVQNGRQSILLDEARFQRYRIYGNTVEIPVPQPGAVYLQPNAETGKIIWEGYTNQSSAQRLYTQGGPLERMDSTFVGKPINRAIVTAAAAVVRVRWAAQGRPTSWCTGSQVAPRIIVTNRHCFPADFDAARPTGETFVEFGPFRGNLEDFAETIPTDVIRLTSSPKVGDFYERDVAILKLRRDPGMPLYRNAVLKLAPAVSNGVPAELLTIWSYSDPKGKAVSRGPTCKLSAPMFGCISGALLHGCEAESGSSGSPILSKASGRIVALHYGGIAQDLGNCAMPVPVVRQELEAAGITGL